MNRIYAGNPGIKLTATPRGFSSEKREEKKQSYITLTVFMRSALRDNESTVLM